MSVQYAEEPRYNFDHNYGHGEQHLSVCWPCDDAGVAGGSRLSNAVVLVSAVWAKLVASVAVGAHPGAVL